MRMGMSVTVKRLSKSTIYNRDIESPAVEVLPVATFEGIHTGNVVPTHGFSGLASGYLVI